MGDRDLAKKELVKYTKRSPDSIERDFNGRGITYNMYPSNHPIIAVDGSFPLNICIATLAHETIHASNFIVEYLGINDHDEFVAHTTAFVLRQVLKDLLKKDG